LIVRRLRPPLRFKQRRGTLLDLVLPLPNQNRMNPVFLPDLVDRLRTPYRLQTTFALNSGVYTFLVFPALIIRFLSSTTTA
jgi:hypothetical protein